jgi:c-di-GMP phosphodiesterase
MSMASKLRLMTLATGYSNLSYLGRLPFDVLKIDKSFMHGIGLQSSSNQVVNMMIDMAHHLGKTVCAEGVENDIQYQFLENAGCDILQGYYLSKPLRTSEFPDFYHSKQTLRNTSHA